MKRNLIIFWILLFIWIAGSSFWYVCKIRDDCKSRQEVPIDEARQEEAPAIIEQSEPEADSTVAEPAKDDPLSKAKEYLQNIPVKSIYFDFAQFDTELSDEDREYIEMLVIFMGNSQDRQVILTGHSDSIGSPEANMYASEHRASFIAKKLAASGIGEDLIKTKGLSDKEPVASNDTFEGRAKNRRVEIKILNQ